jgi:hypothetical protein
MHHGLHGSPASLRSRGGELGWKSLIAFRGKWSHKSCFPAKLYWSLKCWLRLMVCLKSRWMGEGTTKAVGLALRYLDEGLRADEEGPYSGA